MVHLSSDVDLNIETGKDSDRVKQERNVHLAQIRIINAYEEASRRNNMQVTLNEACRPAVEKLFAYRSLRLKGRRRPRTRSTQETNAPCS